MKYQQLKHIIFAFGFFALGSANAQEFKVKIEGQVLNKKGDVAAIHVSNSTRNRGTITDVDGYFSISAQLNDTLVFSAVQFKKKGIIITIEILESKKLEIVLEEALTQLNEVVVMPYNLSGYINRDMNKLEVGQIITASTENLPNAHVLAITQTERKLFAATDLDCNCTGAKLDPLFNYFSGRTKMLNKRQAKDVQTVLTSRVRKYYSDSLYIKDLKIPKNKIDNFVFFSERDSSFNAVATANDKLKLWEFFQRKSVAYRKINNLD